MKRNMAASAIPNIRDDKVWAQLTGAAPGEPVLGPDGQPLPPKTGNKEPSKPRFVIDVYRGDKHVQEIFQ